MKKLYIHGGKFHADDVMCAAMARVANPEVEVCRVKAVPEDVYETFEVVICDIGRGRHDHHQPDAALRPDGRKHAACGLLFNDIWDQLFPNKASADSFRNRYIIPIEDADNGGYPNPLSNAISAFNPKWDEDREKTEEPAFWRAVYMLMDILEEEIAAANARVKAEPLVKEAVEHSIDGVAVLRQYLPSSMFIGTPVKLVVSPSIRGGYQLLCVKQREDEFENAVDLPWDADHLPAGCTFMHAGKFLAAFDTEAHAVSAAMEAIHW